MKVLENIFGLTIECNKWENQKSIPLYISDDYEIKAVKIENIECILLSPLSELGTIPYIKKQIKTIQEVDSKPVALYLAGLSDYRRKSMIENKIPFITDKQAFLPFIGTMLVSGDKEKEPAKKFTYATQLLALLFLYQDEKQLYVSEATKQLPFTAMSLSRAVNQLESTDCFNIYKDGVNKVIASKYEKRELFHKLQPYFKDPIQKKGYVTKTCISEDFAVSGESALAEFTMLGVPRLQTYAVYGKSFEKSLLEKEFIDGDRQVAVEVWGYDPKQFSTGNTVDKISLIISLLDNNDERVEDAVDEIMDDLWSE